jgi:DNA recombination protein RmuC
LRPDFQILLPDNRLIITDSKVSLIAYEKYCSIDDQQQQKTFISDHLKSIYSHIDGLSLKKYDDLQKSLDFTLMFFPVEPAYLLAMQHDPQLWFYAYEKRILLISPTNLIICLKLINDLWNRELQNRNAQEIVNRAEKLYDKFVTFVENFSKIGNQIEVLNKTYETALSQLSSGRGNLISQAQKIKDLGLKSSKKIPEILTNNQDEEDEIIENLDEKNIEKIIENQIPANQIATSEEN